MIQFDIQDYILNTKMQLRYAGVLGTTIHWYGKPLDEFIKFLEEKGFKKEEIKSGINYMNCVHEFHAN